MPLPPVLSQMDNCCGCGQQSAKSGTVQANFQWPGWAPFNSINNGFTGQPLFSIRRYLTLTVNMLWSKTTPRDPGPDLVTYTPFSLSITADAKNNTILADPWTGLNQLVPGTSIGESLELVGIAISDPPGFPGLVEVTETSIINHNSRFDPGTPDTSAVLSNPFSLADCKATALDLLKRLDLDAIDYDQLKQLTWANQLVSGAVGSNYYEAGSDYLLLPAWAPFEPNGPGGPTFPYWVGNGNVTTIVPPNPDGSPGSVWVPSPFTHAPQIVTTFDEPVNPGTLFAAGQSYFCISGWAANKVKYKLTTDAPFCQSQGFFDWVATPPPPDTCTMVTPPQDGSLVYKLDPPDLAPDTRDQTHSTGVTPFFGTVLNPNSPDGCPCTTP